MGDVADLTIPAELDRRNHRSLEEIASSVNETVREVREFQNDRRLKMALDLAEAKAQCAKQDIPFKQWVAENIELVGYPEATKLAKIGAAPDPAEALENRREKDGTTRRSAETKQKVASRGNSEPSASPPARGKEAICTRVKDALTSLAGLPEAAEVAGYFKDSDQSVIVDERLPAAVNWLTEFSDAWENNDAQD